MSDPINRAKFLQTIRSRKPRQIIRRSREEIIATCDPDTQRMIRELDAERRAAR